MNLEPENRRSFVKKSLATSMTLTFAGLIRAHGDGGTGGTTIDPENTYVTTNSGTTTTFDLEGTYYTTIGNTTTFDLEETYETTTYEETTTWDPEETTITTSYEQFVSLQRQEPIGGMDESPAERVRAISERAGEVEILRAGESIFKVPLVWDIMISEVIQFDPNLPYESTQCIQHWLQVDVGFGFNQNGLIHSDELNQVAIDNLLQAIAIGINKALGRNPQILLHGPKIKSAYPVSASWGMDNIANPPQLGAIVNCGMRLGSSSVSSHGYWARVYSNVSPNPSRMVNFEWFVMLRKSKYIDIEKHIKHQILLNFVDLALQLRNPFQSLEVICNISPLPEIIDPIDSFDQLVVAYMIPPESPGETCEMQSIEFSGAEAPQPPNEEPVPATPFWNQDNPEFPPTFFPPYAT